MLGAVAFSASVDGDADSTVVEVIIGLSLELLGVGHGEVGGFKSS